jgi:hypothetical protein
MIYNALIFAVFISLYLNSITEKTYNLASISNKISGTYKLVDTCEAFNHREYRTMTIKYDGQKIVLFKIIIILNDYECGNLEGDFVLKPNHFKVRYRYKEEDFDYCFLTFIFLKNQVFVKEDDCHIYHGVRCWFEGLYEKIGH